MRRTRVSWAGVFLAVVCMSVPAFAQEGGEQAGDKAVAILEALELPEAAAELERAGVENVQIERAIEVIRERQAAQAEGAEGAQEAAGAEGAEGAEGAGSAAAEAARTLKAEAEAAREHGPMANFGDYVKEQVEAGVRGQELAAKIREERERRRPRPERAQAGANGQAGERGQAGDRGQAGENGQAGERGQAGARGAKGKAPGAERTEGEEREEAAERGQGRRPAAAGAKGKNANADQ